MYIVYCTEYGVLFYQLVCAVSTKLLRTTEHTYYFRPIVISACLRSTVLYGTIKILTFFRVCGVLAWPSTKGNHPNIHPTIPTRHRAENTASQ